MNLFTYKQAWIQTNEIDKHNNERNQPCSYEYLLITNLYVYFWIWRGKRS
jgi:hypothetical protein